MVTPSVSTWNTESFLASSRYDAWADTLNGNYGSWDPGKSSTPAFDAHLETVNIGNITLQNCICDPCTADRKAWHINQDTEFFAIQLVLSGKERMCFDGEDYQLNAGDMFIWDSTSPMTFDVIDRLHKISLIMPLDRLRDWLPRTWRSIPRKLPTDSANNILLRSLMTSMVGDDFYRTKVNDTAVSEAAIAMLASGLDQSREAKSQSIRQEQLARLKDYIHKHLHDSDLDISQIAKANKISARYLHWVFGESGSTASRYILELRLETCRRDLLNPVMRARSIAAIAYAAGFSNPSHFTRRYRDFYDESPSETRSRNSA
jgi:AraC-like DNA-binding protein